MTESQTPPSKLAWLPNAVSILRILMAPVVAALVFAGLSEGVGTELLFWALGLFIFAAVTDWLDGFLARALNAQSALGGKLDLWGDKALVAFVFFALWIGWFLTSGEPSFAAAVRAEPLVMVAGFVLFLAIVGRDILVTQLRAKAEARGRVIAPTFLAKSKTAVLMTGLAVTIGGLALVLYPVVFIGYGLVVIGAIISVITAMDYFELSKKRRRKRPVA
jgi:cardiolipin synthase (CMP-forming)